MSTRLPAGRILAILAPSMLALSCASSRLEESGVEQTGAAARQDRGRRHVPQFGGPSSVAADLEETRGLERADLPDLISTMDRPWDGWKDRLEDDYGLRIGVNYLALYQAASKSRGEDEAAAGMLQLLGAWTLTGRGTVDTGSLVLNVQHRHDLGTAATPTRLGFEAGAGLPTGATFDDSGWGVYNVFWQQRFNEGRVTLLVGKVEATDYTDVYALTDPGTHFQNLAFLTDPTIAFPDAGLGAAVGSFLTDNIYVIAGFADANGSADDSGFDTIDEGELFSHAEVGWISSFERRYLDNVHVTVWHVDERDEAGTPDDWGVAFSATRLLDERWKPFVRAGYANGEAAVFDRSVSVGLGRERGKNLVALGLNWGRPARDALDNQYTGELFYRRQFTRHFALTPSVQYVKDPALTREEDSIVFVGLRLRLSL